jgi:hypothetical protein
MTLEQLEQENVKAYTALIDLWSELSRISSLRAKRDIEDDLGSRYTLQEGFNCITFTDAHTGDIFFYYNGEDYWDSI